MPPYSRYNNRAFSVPFIDNIFIFTTTTMDDHISHVMQVIKLLNKYNLRMNVKKCHLGYSACVVLGHVLTGTTRSPDPAKVKAILE